MIEIDSNNIIDSEELLDLLIVAIKTKKLVVERFRFKSQELKNSLLERLNIPISEYEKKYYYITEGDIYISESEFDYVLISTIGFVCYREYNLKEDERIFNAYEAQYEVLDSLIKTVKLLLAKEDVYNIDSYNNEKLGKVCLAIINNLIFYFELFGKSYIILNGKKANKTHRLKDIYKEVKNIMYENKHNDTTFNAFIITEIDKLIEYIISISTDFKEEYVKYDDNKSDCTIISITRIEEIENLIKISNDFLGQLKYDKDECSYLKPGLYERLYRKAKSKTEQEQVRKTYAYLVEE